MISRRLTTIDRRRDSSESTTPSNPASSAGANSANTSFLHTRTAFVDHKGQKVGHHASWGAAGTSAYWCRGCNGLASNRSHST